MLPPPAFLMRRDDGIERTATVQNLLGGATNTRCSSANSRNPPFVRVVEAEVSEWEIAHSLPRVVVEELQLGEWIKTRPS